MAEREWVTMMEFETTLEAGGEGNAWTYFFLPSDVQKGFGSKGRIAVQGTINGFPFRSSVFPNGDGRHLMMVNKEMQRATGLFAGTTAVAHMEPDTNPRTVEVPSDLQALLDQHETAAGIFERLAPSHKKAFVDWIEQAKREETRARRLEKTLEMLLDGKRLN